jgi:hypothetical protein
VTSFCAVATEGLAQRIGNPEPQNLSLALLNLHRILRAKITSPERRSFYKKKQSPLGKNTAGHCN